MPYQKINALNVASNECINFFNALIFWCIIFLNELTRGFQIVPTHADAAVWWYVLPEGNNSSKNSFQPQLTADAVAGWDRYLPIQIG